MCLCMYTYADTYSICEIYLSALEFKDLKKKD